MDEKVEIAAHLATRLKEERKRLDLSLEALSKISGLSRSMLSQIERGESSPTVASLWSLTKALNVDFASLLDSASAEEPAIQQILLATDTPVMRGLSEGCEIRILSAPENVGEVEIYDIAFESGAALESSAHKKGCVESLTVIDGSVDVMSAGERAEVSAGDTIRYRADTDHKIHSEAGARVILVVRNA